jgi:hypothetical protein
VQPSWIRHPGRPQEGARRWIVRRVWVAADDGTKRGGTLWYAQDEQALIRLDRESALFALPVVAQGTRWDFADGRRED